MIFVTEDLDNSPEGKLLRSVRSYVAEVERIKILERTMSGKHAKLLKGEPLFRSDLYGYRPNKEENKFEICEEEAKIVQRIFEMSLSGLGSRVIAIRLNDEGIPSSKPWKAKKTHGLWCEAAIYNILTNPAYKGEEWANKYKQENGKTVKRPESEWMLLPDTLRPAIVTSEIWDASQAGMKARKGAVARNAFKPVLLRGHIFCADCGRLMSLNENSKYGRGHDKYRCNSVFKQYDTKCKGLRVPYNEMNEWIWEHTKAILLDPEIVQREIDRLEQSDKESELASELEALNGKLAKLKRGIQMLLRRLRDAVDDYRLTQDIEREFQIATRERVQLESEIAIIESRLSEQKAIKADIRSLEQYCNRVRNALDSFGFEDKRLAFQGLGLKVFANGTDPSNWRFEIRIPFACDSLNDEPVAMSTVFLDTQ